ncbi:MAG: DoxX family protein [Bacteroidales bacterium]|nr:DoxX family protein [Bacteroidales bacterium]
MQEPKILYDRLDKRITSWMSKYGLVLLRLSIGIVFFWFGILKFFSGLSPAQDLAIRTVDVLAFGLIPGSISIHILAVWEVLIGIGLLTGIYMRVTLFLLFLQMIGTMSPVFLFPAEVFTRIPYAPTLEGQYIIKNLVIISAGFVLGATVSKEKPRIVEAKK